MFVEPGSILFWTFSPAGRSEFSSGNSLTLSRGGCQPILEGSAYSDDGVDLTLIRWMLSLTPAGRLTLQNTIRSLLKLRGLKMRDPGLPNDRFEP